MDGTPRTRARRRARQSASPELELAPAPAPAAIADDVELLEDHTRPVTHHGTGRRLGVSLPGAVLGAFLITALALGASSSSAPVPGSGVGGDALTTATEPEQGDKPDAEQPDADKPDAEQPDADKPDADKPDAEQPADKPDADKPGEDDPKPALPALEGLEIGIGLNDGHVVVEWSACERDGFVAYKIVRSTESTVTYPREANDTLVGVIEASSKTRFVDLKAPEARKLWYRVFAFATHEGVPYTACQSGVEDVTTPKSEPDPTPKPEIASLGLSLSIKEGVPYVDWTACKVDGDFLYKVVRSKDAKITWPLGENDGVVAAVGPDGTTAVFDEEIDRGTKVFYRVFCLRALDEGYKVLASSAVKGIETPAPKPEPLPEPSAMGFEVGVTGEGVVLHWERCTAEQFAFYKVVRSRNPNPSYLPGTEGSEVIAVVENGEITELVDGSAEAGTWFYRVQSIGYAEGQKFLLGQTSARSVTVE